MATTTPDAPARRPASGPTPTTPRRLPHRPVRVSDVDRALDLWVDATGEPATIHLAGTLDGRTSINLCAVVEELLGNGGHDLLVDAGRVVVPDADGIAALARIDRAGRRRGATVTWCT